MVEEARVAVIGSGGFGASTAYHLARRGARDVVLLGHGGIQRGDDPIPKRNRKGASGFGDGHDDPVQPPSAFLDWKIDRLLNDHARLTAMRANATSLARPHAGRDIATTLIG